MLFTNEGEKGGYKEGVTLHDNIFVIFEHFFERTGNLRDDV